MTAERLREIARLLETYGDVATCPVVLQKTSVIPFRAVEDLDRFADELDDGAAGLEAGRG
jgi:dissimilatory sulfite reductase (desulfoviridin) alpha/beta subunit